MREADRWIVGLIFLGAFIHVTTRSDVQDWATALFPVVLLWFFAWVGVIFGVVVWMVGAGSSGSRGSSSYEHRPPSSSSSSSNGPYFNTKSTDQQEAERRRDWQNTKIASGQYGP
jgi:hypothetical protein